MGLTGSSINVKDFEELNQLFNCHINAPNLGSSFQSLIQLGRFGITNFHCWPKEDSLSFALMADSSSHSTSGSQFLYVRARFLCLRALSKNTGIIYLAHQQVVNFLH
jgi:hypothetical protein